MVAGGAALVALVAWSSSRPAPEANRAQAETVAASPAASAPVSAAIPVLQRPVAQAAHPLPAREAKPGPTKVAAASPAPARQRPAALTARQRAELVDAHLQAAEFGPALETAQGATAAGERTELLQKVAAAQAQVGEFRAADHVLARIPVPEKRAEARAENADRESAAGGSADASKLIALIRAVTGGPEDWDDERRTPEFWVPGVQVDPNGMLRSLTRSDKSQSLDALARRAREADLNIDIKAVSELRLVSLTRLEQETARRLRDGRGVPETMQHLAGLSHVRYVFIYPEQHEIVIGGPAEGWRYNESGLAVGRDSGAPTLYLDDLVTVLRTFSPRGTGYFNCLIVPREEGLRAIKQFVEESQAKGSLSAAAVRSWTHQLQQKLGLQDVQINGVPGDSRVAQVIVEADYRMKLIGVGKLDGGSGIPNYFDLLPKTGDVKSQKMDALRWWLSMKYDAVTHSPDRNVFEIQGSAVLCQSENEMITARGQRVHTGQSEATNRLFAANFTHNYATLAKRDTVFADLQNVFDLSLVAALLVDQRIPERLGWDLGVFAPEADGGTYRTARYQPPKTVMSVVNHRVYNGRDIVVQVAGGVDGQVRSVISDGKIFRASQRLASLQQQSQAPALPAGRWWWDAKTR
jgi:hypothetical protein